MKAKKLSDRKATYYSTKVRECKLLHKLTDKLTTNQHQQQLPSDKDAARLANKLKDFFNDKICKIRSGFNLNDDTVEYSFRGEKLENIRPATIDEVKATNPVN